MLCSIFLWAGNDVTLKLTVFQFQSKVGEPEGFVQWPSVPVDFYHLQVCIEWTRWSRQEYPHWKQSKCSQSSELQVYCCFDLPISDSSSNKLANWDRDRSATSDLRFWRRPWRERWLNSSMSDTEPLSATHSSVCDCREKVCIPETYVCLPETYRSGRRNSVHAASNICLSGCAWLLTNVLSKIRNLLYQRCCK